MGVGGFNLGLGSPGLGGMPSGLSMAQLVQLNAVGMNPFSNMNMLGMANLPGLAGLGGMGGFAGMQSGISGGTVVVLGHGGPGRSGGRSPPTAKAVPHPQETTAVAAARR